MPEVGLCDMPYFLNLVCDMPQCCAGLLVISTEKNH